MKKLLFFLKCKKCKHELEFVCDDGKPDNGRVLLSQKTWLPAVVYFLKDPVFSEVSHLFDDMLKFANMNERKEGLLFDKVFGEICDLAPDGSTYDMSGIELCPRCGSKEISWGPTCPPKYKEVEIPEVSHTKWDKLDSYDKRELIKEILEREPIKKILEENQA